jgi:hypothetical protein
VGDQTEPRSSVRARSAAASVGALIVAVAAISLLAAGCTRDPVVPGHRPSTASAAHAAHFRISGRLLAVGGPAGVKAELLSGTVTAVNLRTDRSYAATARSDGRYALHVPVGRYRLVGRSPLYLSGEPGCSPARPVVKSRDAGAVTADVICQRR